ncbi:hypothetical protein CEXT_677241 [Caerostris extrusa]|uniref:Uncharacterized protein n=1 Tax=Caerostris extrusa TaxID=172846 RepID=A0AAV4NLS8_CAEEX|nr:hypothetical protein CEXT_677241 [Caerostris extrusa]
MQRENALTAKENTQPSTEDAQISQGETLPQQRRIYPTPPQKPRIKISLDENLTNHQIIPEGEKRTYANVIRDQNEQTCLPTIVPSKLHRIQLKTQPFRTYFNLFQPQTLLQQSLFTSTRTWKKAPYRSRTLVDKQAPPPLRLFSSIGQQRAIGIQYFYFSFY